MIRQRESFGGARADRRDPFAGQASMAWSTAWIAGRCSRSRPEIEDESSYAPSSRPSQRRINSRSNASTVRLRRLPRGGSASNTADRVGRSTRA